MEYDPTPSLTALDVAVETMDFDQAELYEVLAAVRRIRGRQAGKVIDLEAERLREEPTGPRPLSGPRRS